MIPGKSRICIGAPWTLTVPGTVVSVVKSISETSECVPVSLDISVDFPTGGISLVQTVKRTEKPEGKPMKPTLATPVL